MDKTLGMLGLAQKAGRVQIGEEPVGTAAAAGKADGSGPSLFVLVWHSDNGLERQRCSLSNMQESIPKTR